jgi:hypothetical protein
MPPALMMWAATLRAGQAGLDIVITEIFCTALSVEAQRNSRIGSQR